MAAADFDLQCQSTYSLSSAPASATFVVTVFSRPAEVRRIIDSALQATVVDRVLISQHNPLLDLSAYDIGIDPRVDIVRAPVASRPGFRWTVVDRFCRGDVIVVDDDTILTARQIDVLFQRLRTDPTCPHGVTGSRYPTAPYVDSSTGGPRHTFHRRVEARVDALHQVYAVTTAHVAGYRRLTVRLPSSELAVAVADDIVISSCGRTPATIHDLGPVELSASSRDPAVAVHLEPRFNHRRARILVELDELGLRHRTTAVGGAPAAAVSDRSATP